MANTDPAPEPEGEHETPAQPVPAETGGEGPPAPAEPPVAVGTSPGGPVASSTVVPPVDATAHQAAVPLTGSPSFGPAPPRAIAPPIAAPKTGLRSFGVLIAVGVALVLVLAVTLVVTLTGGGVSGAEDRVLSYYENLSDKDGEGARKLLENVKDDLFDSTSQLGDRVSDSPFWENPTLAHGYSPPTEVEVTSSTAQAPSGVRPKPDLEYAFVTVGYTVAGHPATESFGLERKPKGDWQIIMAAVGNLYLGEGALQFEIAGKSTEDFEVDESVAAPPGGYEASLADHEIFEDSKSDIAVTPGLNGSYGASTPLATMDAKVRPDALDEVESQVESLIDDCAADDGWDVDMSTCPWSGEDPDETPMELDGPWKVNAYPEIEIVVGNFGQAVVETVEPGSATFEDGDATVDLVPEGRVAVENGEVVWHSDERY